MSVLVLQIKLLIPYKLELTFDGAATTSSTEQNPANICYNTAGNYTVTLTAANANGNDTETKTLTLM